MNLAFYLFLFNKILSHEETQIFNIYVEYYQKWKKNVKYS